MALSHTDTDIQKVKINKFSTLADFTAAQTGGLIGPDEISFVDEPINADWNQSDSTKADYIKNKPTIPDEVSGTNDGTNWTSLTIGSDTYAIPSGGGSSTLSGLTDTNISSPSDGQMLKYDNATSKWVNANVPMELPTITGNANKILAVNSGATGVEWITNSGGGGGLTNYDFTHTANQSVSGSVTVTYAANTRGSRMVSASADLSVTFAVNNSSDNYLWIKNTGSSDIDILISSVTYNNSSVSNVYMPADGITVSAGKVCEIGIVCNADGAFITSRSDLSL